ncbi:Hypothetical predicted protein [Mytilus galloprovincialis]|uniref:guanylate cyclase n=1 Tax=Mytilus galloprovincialis TaxID=29158 RepID=A0A8B6DYG5_MYTGA|nr:Hypothetical predicted protein [Mytilus galloprovincialis]
MLTLDKVDNFGYTVLTVTNMSLAKVDQLYGDVFKINYTFKYAGERCTPKGKMTTIAETKYSTGIDVFIGPVCGTDLEIAACMASSWNIPIISTSGSSDLVTNKTEFSTLTNMAFTMEKFALFYVRLFNFYHWENIILIYEEKHPLLSLLAKSLYDVFIRMNITTIILPFKERNFEPLLQEGSKHSRVFATISTDDDFRKLILAAQSLGMTNGEYVHLFIRFYEVEHTGLHSWERKDEFDEVARSAYDSVLVLQPSRPESKLFTQFVKDVKEKAFNEYNYTMHNEEVNIFTTAFYDSISVYAQIINETITNGGDIRDGLNISKRMKNRVFHGISGKISIDKNGDREPDFQLLDMNMDSGDFVIVAEYFGSIGTMVFRNDTSIHWPSDRGPPKNIPDCGFKGDNPHCKVKVFNSTGLIAGLFVAVFLVVGVAGLIMNRRLKKEADLKSQWWNIRLEDIIFRSQVVGSKHSKFSMLMSTDELRSLQNEITSTTTDFTSHNKKPAIYKMKDLQCNNLVKFFGLYRTLRGVFLVMEDCSRGSLQDILQNDSLNLDWDFKAALVTDLANGMSYLHASPILIHGRLNSDRCIIDSRFVLKISEFGLPSILGSNHLECVENEKECIWFAPECLRGDKVSQSSDVYSFAMIMFEILTRMSPFEEETEKTSIHDVIRKVKTKGDNPFRPSLPALSDDVPKMIDLMQACWDESLFKRPTFRSIKKQLKEITGYVHYSVR